jgi:hypothetical protein
MKKSPSFAVGSSFSPGNGHQKSPAFIQDPARTGSALEPEATGEAVPLAQLGRVPISDTDNLNETVLGSAAVGDPDTTPPEVVKGTEALTEWDQRADATGTWTPREGVDDGVLDAARLYEAGIEEADRERRLAAHEPDES